MTFLKARLLRHLHSPWRSAYIGTFKEKKKPNECLFCRIAAEDEDAKNLIVWRGKTCYVVLNRYPYNSGHLMVVPYRHLGAFQQLRSAEHREIMEVTGRCMKALDTLSIPHGYNFGANLGRVAGAGIEQHIHFHLVPRWNGDTNFMPVLAEVKVVSERLEDLQVSLSKELKKNTRSKTPKNQRGPRAKMAKRQMGPSTKKLRTKF